MKNLLLRIFRIKLNPSLWKIFWLLNAFVIMPMSSRALLYNGNIADNPLLFILLITGVSLIIFFTFFVVISFAASSFSLRKYTINTQKNSSQANSFISEIDRKREDICLILRPFGSDGNIQVKNENFITHLFPNISITIEEIIREKFNEYNYRVVAVKNPNQFINIRNIDNIEVQDIRNWKKDVEKLITRSAYIIFIFPSKSALTNSVRWEIMTSINKGLIPRILFIFPPRDKKTSFNTINELFSLINKKNNIDNDILHAIYSFHLKSKEEYNIHYIKGKKFYEKRKIQINLTKTYYESAIEDFLIFSHRNLKEMSFFQKYPYY